MMSDACVARQKRFMHEGVAGMLRDKSGRRRRRNAATPFIVSQKPALSVAPRGTRRATSSG
jgi:hypothetical protein